MAYNVAALTAAGRCLTAFLLHDLFKPHCERHARLAFVTSSPLDDASLLKVVFRPVQAELLQSLCLSRRLQGVVLCCVNRVFAEVLRK